MAQVSPPEPVVDVLLCPVCREMLTRAGGTLACPAGHAFDIARQGYVNLLGRADGDTAAMVADRSAFLAAGHYTPLASLVARWAADAAPGLVVDAGAGTGYYLAAVLARGGFGLALDASPSALRRAARAHERIGAAVWDVWRPWPVRDGVAAVVLNVFAPRNGPEFHRVLRPDGTLLVVTPTRAHLAELGAAGLLSVDPHKAARLAETLVRFERVRSAEISYPMALSAADVRRVIGMGPAAHHDPVGLDEDREVTASFLVSAYRPG
ncbi:MAG TPA: rRNA (guanine-N1)-methyltransferase [Pseudonocardiaceae bacterium]